MLFLMKFIFMFFMSLFLIVMFPFYKIFILIVNSVVLMLIFSIFMKSSLLVLMFMIMLLSGLMILFIYMSSMYINKKIQMKNKGFIILLFIFIGVMLKILLMELILITQEYIFNMFNSISNFLVLIILLSYMLLGLVIYLNLLMNFKNSFRMN